MNHASRAGETNTWAAGASAGMNQGMAVIPYALLRYYHAMGMNSSECMLLIHLLAFQQVEHNGFPSLEELQQVTGTGSETLAMSLQKLMKEGFLAIDEHTDEERGIQYERYNLNGLYTRLGQLLAKESEEEAERLKSAGMSYRGIDAVNRFNSPASPKAAPEQEEPNLFRIFEKEFGRPLSPMELQMISGWVDEDRYPNELILLALKEAVFAGKVHFRYIDRILLEWSRNRVRTAQDAKAYTQKFRNIGR
ncbi:DnaD domain-containing protein [Paenibacillus dakarensis]|uniref:DnaD domain-containing protein n=1 Tax=Paenibacillus dakarensis TaxID=1527293 RepID=UPI0006D5868D|nr:DnaD domain-containing protein [Paenibacillus dakarensis]